MLNRETGEPIWPFEERPVEKGNVPGEYYSPTQPFPTKPPAYERQSVSIDELIDFTPELRAEAVELVKKYTMGGLFNPPVREQDRRTASARSTRSTSGTNWKGGSYDPENARGLRVVDRHHRRAMGSCLRLPDSRRWPTSPATR